MSTQTEPTPSTAASCTRKRRIYCFNNGGSPGWLSACAMAEDGHCLAQHICSHESFMLHDLGMISDWKHDQYNAHFGEGNWELEWVSNPRTHEGLQAAFALNQKLREQHDAAAELKEEGCSNNG